MAIVSGGQLVLSDNLGVSRTVYYGTTGLDLANLHASYATIYRSQLWVYVVVSKRARATRRLPLKVYSRGDDGREEVRDDPYARLLRNPNPRHSSAFLWEWTSSTLDLYGEAVWLKVRGRDGQPAQLWPVHPTTVYVKREDDGSLTYRFSPSGYPTTDPQFIIPEADIVHFKVYNPDSTLRGLSALEPLRQSLVNEDAARRANSAFWTHGARPSVALSHPGKLSPGAIERLKANWDSIHGGADNFGKTAILEEGMKPEILSLGAEDSQYIESRKLNREEVCGAYDIPPPVVHILDRATFSNITEQMRSMYRDTMAPHLSGLEATLDLQLRPDFDPVGDVYAEFLMDEVLRGDFEQRVTAYQTGINSGWLTPAEVREMENLPAVEGADRLFINAALIPIKAPSIREQMVDDAKTFNEADLAKIDALGQLVRAGFDPQNAAEMLGLSGLEWLGHLPVTVQSDAEPLALPAAKSMRDVMGRLSRVKSLDDIDPVTLTEGLNGLADRVLDELQTARADGVDVAEFRRRLAAVGKE